MNNQKIMVNDKEYDTENLNGEQNYLVQQIADLSQQLSSHKFKIDQIMVAQEVFSAKLTQLLEEPE
jgi:hypothetical protein|tara:strand:+ start:828 stop:1025 length:198 start_codon:yes stop_codon:yes gene_type:complete